MFSYDVKRSILLFGVKTCSKSGMSRSSDGPILTAPFRCLPIETILCERVSNRRATSNAFNHLYSPFCQYVP